MKHLTVVALAVLTISAGPAAAQTIESEPPPPQDQTSTATQTDAGKTAPVHTRTGWAALFKDTADDFVAFPKRRSTWALLGIGAGAAMAAHPADSYVETHIVGDTTADRVFSVGQWAGSAYVQVGSAVGLWAVGRYIVAPAAAESRTNKYSEIGYDLIRAQILSQSLVHGLKYSIRRDRPTGECCAFPSGHSATAFAAAAVLERHLGYRASWPALAAAAYVGASRLVDNRHFLSDVVFGAAIGTASGWTVVGTRGRSRVTLEPVPVKGGLMIALTRVDDSRR
jgi:membrane-associated phospholipid phosphatase